MDDYRELIDTPRSLHRKCVRLAVVDAGYSSFQHIIKLQPDIIKLDMELTRNVDADPARRALASALIRFAQDTGNQILAEGIETLAEMETLEHLGVTYGQGFLLGRPAGWAEAQELINDPSAARETLFSSTGSEAP